MLTGVVGWLLSGDAAAPIARFEITLPGELRNDSGWDISSDGSALVFAATPDAREDRQLYIRRLDELAPEPIPGTQGADWPRFSPDGASVAYFVNESIRTVSLDGAPPLTVVRDSAYSIKGLSWGADGRIYFGKLQPGSGVWRVEATGGAMEQIAPPNAEHAELLPSRSGLLFERREARASRIAVYDLATGETRDLFEGYLPRYVSAGYVLYTSADRAGTLLAAPFDEDQLEATGPPRTILEGLMVDVNAASDVALSSNGTLIYRAGRSGPGEGELVWLRRGGAAESVAPELSGVIESVALSPDGRRIAFDRAAGERRDLWVHDLVTETTTRLTDEGDANIRPEWSPDGTEVGFVRQSPGAQAFFSIPANGSGPTRIRRAPVPGSVIWEGLWTPDMNGLLYRELPRAGVAYILYAFPEPDSVSRPIVRSEYFNAAMSLSPDGRWLTYQSDESGQNEVYVRPLPGPGGAIMVSRGGGTGPIWVGNGSEIIYVSGGNWMVATVRTAPAFAVESREVFASTDGYYSALTIQRYDVTRDGERILAIRDLSEAPSQLIVVQNFFEELRERVPR